MKLATLNIQLFKIKHVWDNQIPFFDKELSKAIMTRTKYHDKETPHRFQHFHQGKKLLLSRDHKTVTIMNLIIQYCFEMPG